MAGTHTHTAHTAGTHTRTRTSRYPRGRTVHVVNVVENGYRRVVHPGGDLLDGVGELDPLRARAAHMSVVRAAVGAWSSWGRSWVVGRAWVTLKPETGVPPGVRGSMPAANGLADRQSTNEQRERHGDVMMVDEVSIKVVPVGD